MTTERYTSYPRPVLWLVPEGEVASSAAAHAAGDLAATPPETTIAPFYLSTIPVTNRQLEAWQPTFTRSPLSPDADGPALGVSYEEALGYCAWYSRVARKAIRLPTELEWEHACRAGRPELWPWGADTARAEEEVWHRGNSSELAPPLAAKRSNPFGLHAMHGGVWEWVGASAGRPPVLRGGSWRTPIEEIAAGGRRLAAPGERPADAGFRIAKSLRG